MIRRALFMMLALATPAVANEPIRQPVTNFTAADVFNLEFADDPQISPNGRMVAYVRVSADIMTDRFRRSLWLVDTDGRNHRPFAQGPEHYRSPVWSPSGDALAYLADAANGGELRVFDIATARSRVIARLPSGVANLTWSPDGRTLAFQALVRESGREPASLPPQPEGATWSPPARVIEDVVFRRDGDGLLRTGYTQIFINPADGGTPRQMTFAPRHHNGQMSWSPDGRRLIFAANAEENWQLDPIESDLYALDVASGAITQLTNRDGPEAAPTLSPDGRRLAYVGFDDRRMGYHVRQLYVANADGTNVRTLTPTLDRDVRDPQWVGNGMIYFLFEDHGVTKIGRVGVQGGSVATVFDRVGGIEIGRPYTSGAFSVNRRGQFATVLGDSQQPGDVIASSGGATRRLTTLNEDALSGKNLSAAQPISAWSSADGREIEAWIVRPPHFDPAQQYPLLLEIHGGPFAAYGPNFSAEAQLYAAAGYIVVYANPRGSTSYGDEFANLIHHNYPSQDFDDLMSVVDAVIAQQPVDSDRLFVTGGSGGGVLTAWIVGSTPRFRAAAVQKPVINWTSWVLTADFSNFFAPYWFGEFPWEDGAQQRYWARSPLSRVGAVTTPTAVIVGEEDFRTPTSEAEQYYQALRLRGVPTRLIHVPESPHDLAWRPTGMIAKVRNTLAWFAEHGGAPLPDARTGAHSGTLP